MQTVELSKGNKTFSQVANVGVAAALVLAANGNRRAALLRNVGATDCYLGKDNTVTSANGFLLKATDPPFMDARSIDAWYAITASGTTTLAVIEVAN